MPRAVWVAGALALVAAAAVGLLVRHTSSPERSARPVHTVSDVPLRRAAPSPTVFPVPLTPTPELVLRLAGRPCPSRGSCAVAGGVPRALALAVRHYLPQAERTSANSATFRDASGKVLVGRTLEAHVGASTLLVRVRTYQHSSGGRLIPAITMTPPGLSSAFLHVETPGFAVDMQWLGSEDTFVPMRALRELAADPRLTVLS